MISTQAIRLALRNRFLDTPGLPAHVEVENVEAPARPPGEPWARESFMPAAERKVAFGNPGMHEVVGIVQYSVFYPFGSGTQAAEDMADAIKNNFRPGVGVGGLVRIDRSEVERGMRDEAWWHVPVTVYWRVNRPP